ncbi:2-oxoglutarate dehydrogenase E1 component [bacterium]|nr:2-oxoglutarate dehydrogenase E1 component [bacterium]
MKVDLGQVASENLGFVEELYDRFLEDPKSVEPDWREVFTAIGPPARVARAPFVPRSIFSPAGADGRAGAAVDDVLRQARVVRLVEAYRVHGHLAAKLDPLGTPHDPRPHPELEPASYGLTERDLDLPLVTDAELRMLSARTLRELLASLQEIYTSHVGIELAALDEPVERDWLEDRMESTGNKLPLSREQKQRILERLTASQGLEQFLHTRYVGTKRFSLEGAEGLIPLLDLLIEGAGEHGAREIVFGMPHRGRLNVLVNVLGKDPSELLSEFEDLDPKSTLGSGDVKYHLGFSHDYETARGKKLHLSLTFNPSHLEAVDPVALGRARAKQDRARDNERTSVLPVLLHGDAAFAGQGLVPETLNLAALQGYRTGGTIHVVVNNQIGFTTSPRDSRSTIYATDVALASHCPIFHVNGEDPEAIAQVVSLAVDYRHVFKKDVVIDMYCYRKYGHNEADEPSFTQPLLYKKIEAHPGPLAVYVEKLLGSGEVTKAEVEKISEERVALLEAAFEKAHASKARPQIPTLGGIWQGYKGGADADVPEVATAVARDVLEELLERLAHVPESFHPHPKIAKFLEARAQMRRGERPLDWGAGEALAFATLLVQKARVRLSGQDSRRGTFSHRHSVLTDIENGSEYAPLSNLRAGQAEFNVYDSALSEAGVFGFDYGYASELPDGLVIWEAQFGDFVNGAQVIIDQYLSSAEDKWKRLSGLTVFLPHGFEGQGPEHSSARLERWLTLCAEDDMQVCQPTTPAQHFHLLRRQVVRPWRKPLVVLTPKSLLRHPKATSSLDDLASGSFQRVIPDLEASPSSVRRVLLCTGKVYFDLLARREKDKDAETAIVRLEQLYPFPEEKIQDAIARFPKTDDVAWVQDEPRNMGAWTFLLSRGWPRLANGLVARVVSRPESASPATGSAKAHAFEQEALVSEAFGKGA